MVLGGIPGLALDRTGVALLGAIAMVGMGAISLDDALHSVDVATLLLLYGLMVVSAQFRLGGFYTFVALRLTRRLERPGLFLAQLMVVAAVLSAVLANDIVCLAFTPVLAVSLRKGGLNPVPFLLGLAASSNIGSAATIIGNPQNMLIGQVGHLGFGPFLLWCLPPTLVSLAAAWAILAVVWRGRWRAVAVEEPVPAVDWPPFNRWQTAKGLLVTAAVMALFFTSVPRELTALCAAGVLLLSRRMQTRSLLGLIDWHLITLFTGLFIIIKALEMTGVPAGIAQALSAHGADAHNLYALTGISAALSNLVSNVPATMILLRLIDPSHPVQAYVLALSSTFAGNLITLGSIANLIVIEQARAVGVTVSFREHARTGVPITLASLVATAAWIALAA